MSVEFTRTGPDDVTELYSDSAGPPDGELEGVTRRSEDGMTDIALAVQW
jgi:hypothetical protein